MNTTTRRHPRTLHEAFPRDAWCAFHHEPGPGRNKVLSVLLATVIGSLFAAALVHWLAGA